MEEFINKVENDRLSIKKKLDISLYIFLSLIGISIILLIFGIIYSNAYCYLFLFIFLLIGLVEYTTCYSIFNSKYIKGFKAKLINNAISYSYGDNYIFDPTKGIDFDLMADSYIFNRPDIFKSDYYLSSEVKGVKFITSLYKVEYEHTRTDSKGNTTTYYNTYTGRFIRYEVKRNNVGFMKIDEGNVDLEAFKDPRIGKKIEFEYMEFNKKFKVKTTDELKANYIITPQFQTDLVDFDNAFDSNLKVIFKDKYVYVFMAEKSSPIGLGIYKKMNEKVFKSYVKEFIAPKLLIDVLHLDDDKFMNENL